MSEDPRLGLPSASAMEIIQACPGMVNLRNKLPKEPPKETEEDEWAARGTRIHSAFETGNTLELNQEENETYQVGVRYQNQILEKWMADKVLSPAEVEEGAREHRVWLHSQINWPQPIGSAQLDRHWLAKERGLLMISDLKGGWNPNLPTPAQSWQLSFQAICLWREEYPWAKEIRVAYVKAKDKHEYGDHCDYEIEHLKMAWDSIQFVLWQSTQEDAPRHAGPHCRWCPCKAHCPEALAFALLPSTMIRMSKDGRKRVVHADEVIPEDLYKLWEFKGAIGAILEAVIDRLKTFTDDDLAKIGLMKGKPREGRYFKDLEGACQFLTEEKQLFSAEQVWQHMDLALGPLASIYAQRTGNTEEASKEYLKGVLAPYMGVKEGERSIVRLK